MTITEIINNFDVVINYFVPGILFVYIYNVLSLKRYDLTLYILIGTISGAIIKSIVDSINGFLLNFICLPIPILFAYFACAIILAVSYYKLKNNIHVRKFFTRTLQVETSDNFWTRYWDMAGDAAVYVYTNDGNVSFGSLQSADENDILLIQHRTAFGQREKDIDLAFDEPAKRTILRIPMKNVSRIELDNINKNSEIEKFVFGEAEQTSKSK